MLDLGGSVEVILPAADYRERKVKPANAAEFDQLISEATGVRTLPFERSDRQAYLAASEELLGAVERVIAVWDGKPSNGHGGTADVVHAARERGLPITVVWPPGASRE